MDEFLKRVIAQREQEQMLQKHGHELPFCGSDKASDPRPILKESRRTCRECGKSFEWITKRGKPPAYCSDACRAEAGRKFNRENMRRYHAQKREPIQSESAPEAPGTCDNCKGPFAARENKGGRKQRFCSRRCKGAFHEKKPEAKQRRKARVLVRSLFPSPELIRESAEFVKRSPGQLPRPLGSSPHMITIWMSAKRKALAQARHWQATIGRSHKPQHVQRAEAALRAAGLAWVLDK